ncbi:enoyl-CoA hydratase/isomerase family protein [Cumulibacter soli]|uniref:enoyl-CoA hydratase/isomerase family protein n=1 Tax=Cumulibacter soli TaxID=2546344 RepID=UPI001067E69F|nr:enoyl-CoA hydratase/isomerase family protein [Cumulibacter soli]
MSDITVDINDFVAVVEIHRPPNNFFDFELIADIANAYEQIDADPDARAIVLCSEGKHFCAGANFAPSGNEQATGGGVLYREAVRLFAAKTPVVAAVRGSAIGGGLGLAVSADFRVASAESRFAANFTQLGFHPGFGLSVTLPALIGQQAALDMILTGRRVKGDEAQAMGLCDELVADADVRQAAWDKARQIASAAPLAVVASRATLRGDLAERVRVMTDHELEEQTRLRATADFKEGIAATAERRTANFIGQ